MKLFRCTCESQPVLFFENVQCESCGRMTGFCPESMTLKAFQEAGPQPDQPENVGQMPVQQVWTDDDGREYLACANWVNHQVCNWMLPVDPQSDPDTINSFDTDPDGLCPACRLNDVIPDLTIAENLPLWRSLEIAKRRCLFTMLELRLPIQARDIGEGSRKTDPLQFRFMSDKDSTSHFQRPLKGEDPVLTGHADGVITINLAEADDIARTQTQVAMEESYRTLLGHFRHESGHYYWELFNNVDPGFAERFRAIFGDETASYQDALDRHYEQGPPTEWQNDYVSTYATMHPWEDWAETWAHYIHIIDTLETHQSFSQTSGLLANSVRKVRLPFFVGSKDNSGSTDFGAIVDLWMEASVIMNSLNRSMGLPDPYPFVLHEPIREKLRCVHETIRRYVRTPYSV